MYEIIFLYCLALIWIIFAVVQDIKSREIANWLNYSLIIFAIGFRFFYSLFNGEFEFLYQGLIGLGIFFVLSNIFYYSKFYAGGDMRLMVALGAILPFSYNFIENLRYMGLFLLIFFIVAVIYSLGASVILSIKYNKKFKREFKKLWEKMDKIIKIIMVVGLILMILGLYLNVLFYFGVFTFLLPLIFIFAKSVDEACMVKKVKVGKLTVGDWLYKDVKVGGKVIKAKWDGLMKKDITLLKKYKKNVWVRYGVPFSPVFLISFIFMVFYLVKYIFQIF